MTTPLACALTQIVQTARSVACSSCRHYSDLHTCPSFQGRQASLVQPATPPTYACTAGSAQVTGCVAMPTFTIDVLSSPDVCQIGGSGGMLTAIFAYRYRFLDGNPVFEAQVDGDVGCRTSFGEWSTPLVVVWCSCVQPGCVHGPHQQFQWMQLKQYREVAVQHSSSTTIGWLETWVDPSYA